MPHQPYPVHSFLAPPSLPSFSQLRSHLRITPSSSQGEAPIDSLYNDKDAKEDLKMAWLLRGESASDMSGSSEEPVATPPMEREVERVAHGTPSSGGSAYMSAQSVAGSQSMDVM